jgi:hypothetical protein
MKKPAVNHHKAHKSPQWRSGAWSPRPGAPSPGSRPVPSRSRPGGRVPVPRSRRLNWTLRRYVRASSLRVWLRRQAPEAGGAPVSAGGDGLRPAGGRLGAAAAAGPVVLGTGALGPVVLGTAVLATAVADTAELDTAADGTARARAAAPGGRPRGVSLSSEHALRYGVNRNRQMEHLTQVAEGLRGGVRRGAAITTRERGAAPDLGLATLSDMICMQSNIFKFVMT